MSLVVIAVIVAVAAAVAASTMFAVHRLGGDHAHFELDRGTTAFGFVGTAFTVLLGFIVFLAFESYDEAGEGVEIEAIATVNLTRIADSFDDQDWRAFTEITVCYGRAVVHFDWPAMRRGAEGSPVVDRWTHDLIHVTEGFQVRTPVQEAAMFTLFEEQDKWIEARRARLHEAVRGIPTPMWFLLLLGGVMTVGWILLLTDRRERRGVQAASVGSVAALVMAMLLLVWFLDHPYNAQTEIGGISPSEMTEAIEVIEDEARVHGGLSPPCDERGVRAG
jgi:Protein of unknown function (DUF4239)